MCMCMYIYIRDATLIVPKIGWFLYYRALQRPC